MRRALREVVPGVSGMLRNSLVGDTARLALMLWGVPVEFGRTERVPLRFWILRGSMDLRRRWPPRGMRAMSIVYGDSGSQAC